MTTFTKGDRVVRNYIRRNHELHPGTVLSVDERDLDFVLVEWDKERYATTTAVSKEHVNHVMLETDARAQKTKIEEDFDKLAHELESKVKQAVALLNEAATIADNSNSSLKELDSAFGDLLLTAIENAGWNMSSAHCG